jgi:hypothetical protein
MINYENERASQKHLVGAVGLLYIGQRFRIHDFLTAAQPGKRLFNTHILVFDWLHTFFSSLLLYSFTFS